MNYVVRLSGERTPICTSLFTDALSSAVDCGLTEEKNLAGSLSLTIPPGNLWHDDNTESYDLPLRAIINVFGDDGIIWKGRTVSKEFDINNFMTVYSEGALSFLNDAFLPEYDFSEDPLTLQEFFDWVIDKYNELIVRGTDYGGRKFVVESVEDPTGIEIDAKNDSHEKCFDCISSNVIDKYGGYIKLTYSANDDDIHLHYISDYSTVNYYCDKVNYVVGDIVRYEDFYYTYKKNVDAGESDFEDPLWINENVNKINNRVPIYSGRIEYGTNMTDLTITTDTSDLFTIIEPYGKNDEESGEPVTIESSSYGDGTKIIALRNLFSKYGKIRRTATFQDISDPDTLYLKAFTLLSDSVVMQPSVQIECVLNPADEEIKLYDYVNVVSFIHGINTYTDKKPFMCIKREIDLLSLSKSKYSLGKDSHFLSSII